jgi:hypothetical protein
VGGGEIRQERSGQEREFGQPLSAFFGEDELPSRSQEDLGNQGQPFDGPPVEIQSSKVGSSDGESGRHQQRLSEPRIEDRHDPEVKGFGIGEIGVRQHEIVPDFGSQVEIARRSGFGPGLFPIRRRGGEDAPFIGSGERTDFRPFFGRASHSLIRSEGRSAGGEVPGEAHDKSLRPVGKDVFEGEAPVEHSGFLLFQLGFRRLEQTEKQPSLGRIVRIGSEETPRQRETLTSDPSDRC